MTAACAGARTGTVIGRRALARHRGAMLALVLIASPAVAAPAPNSAHERAVVVRLDPGLDRIVSARAELDTLYRRETIFEGPAWVRQGRSGYLLFSDVPGNLIGRLDPGGRVSTHARDIFRGQSQEAFRSSGRQPFTMLGPNGITLDHAGRIVYCEFSDGEIVRIERDGRRTVLASRYGGQRLNALNDLVYAPDGALYFTDSRAGSSRSGVAGVPYKALYRLRDGVVELVSRTIDHPNGLAFSPDGQRLYVTNTLRRNVLRFDVNAAGVSNETVFVDMAGVAGDGGPDGIKVDRAGNVYVSGPGGIWLLSPDGRRLGMVATPTVVTNLAFGPDERTLYVTSMGALYRLRMR